MLGAACTVAKGCGGCVVMQHNAICRSWIAHGMWPLLKCSVTFSGGLCGHIACPIGRHVHTCVARRCLGGECTQQVGYGGRQQDSIRHVGHFGMESAPCQWFQAAVRSALSDRIPYMDISLPPRSVHPHAMYGAAAHRSALCSAHKNMLIRSDTRVLALLARMHAVLVQYMLQSHVY